MISIAGSVCLSPVIPVSKVAGFPSGCTSAEVIGVAQDPFTERDNFVLSGIGQRIKADIRADIRDGERIKEIFRQYQPEIVFHLAAQPLVRLSYDIPVDTNEQSDQRDGDYPYS